MFNFSKFSLGLAILAFLVFIPQNILAVEEDLDYPHYGLKVKSITVTPGSPAVGQDCIISIKIQNNGNLQLLTSKGLSSYEYIFPGFKRTSISYDKPSIDDVFWPDEYLYFTFEGQFTEAGTQKLEFTIDKINELSEHYEDDNYGAKDVKIQSRDSFDIKVNEIEVSEEEPIINIDLDIEVTIKNNSNIDLIDETGLEPEDRYPQLEGFDIRQVTCDEYPTATTTLGSGEKFLCTYSGRFLESGELTLGYTIDKKNIWEEADEENNYLEEVITVYRNEAERDKFKITDFGAVAISSTTAQVYWATDKVASGTAWWEERPYNLYKEKEITKNYEEHTARFEDLIKGEKYYYRVIARYRENEESTGSVEFTMPLNDEIIFSNENVDIDGSTATVTWNTNMIGSSFVYYKKAETEDYSKKSVNNGIVDHEMVLENLADGVYDYYIASENYFGEKFSQEPKQFTIGTVETTEPEETTETQEQTTTTEETQTQTQTQEISAYQVANDGLYASLKGKIMLTVEANGEAYYIHPENKEMYYLGRPGDAFSVMREQGIGISNELLEKIPIGLVDLSGDDSDGDGLSDIFEDAIGTDKDKKDTDGDGYDDKDELSSGYSPKGAGEMNTDAEFAGIQKGKIFLQVEQNGEAWYINPQDGKRYFLGRPSDAFSVMRNLGLGISNDNFDSMAGEELE